LGDPIKKSAGVFTSLLVNKRFVDPVKQTSFCDRLSLGYGLVAIERTEDLKPRFFVFTLEDLVVSWNYRRTVMLSYLNGFSRASQLEGFAGSRGKVGLSNQNDISGYFAVS